MAPCLHETSPAETLVPPATRAITRLMVEFWNWDASAANFAAAAAGDWGVDDAIAAGDAPPSSAITVTAPKNRACRPSFILSSCVLFLLPANAGIAVIR